MEGNTESSNDAIVGTKEAAKILGVSESTIRRLADNNKINSYRISYNQYRKFKIEELESFKDNFIEKFTHTGENQEQLTLYLDSDNSFPQKLRKIKAKSHPSHYLMHKYWGRKAHNVIAEYIGHYTSPGEIVFDPFAGSGVVPIEAIKAGRKGIGGDINPMSKFIAINTVMKIDLGEFEKISNEILHEIIKKYNYFYKTECPNCGKDGYIETSVWENDKLSKIKGRCSVDGLFIKDADKKDLELYKNITELKEKLDKEHKLTYPKDPVLQYVRRSGKERLDELFNDRALILLSSLRKRISEVEKEEMKSLLMFSFTSMLANVSKMLPGDLDKATYKSGWVISKFWVPKVHTERNVFNCFRLRIKAIIRGKRELLEIDSSLMDYFVSDSARLNFLEDNSIDYIFTDPPYGESIAYLALSQFWNSWLDNLVDYDNEIIIDSYREKGYDEYYIRMFETFKELYRVLKPNKFLSFTFHNRDLNVWKSVMDACKNSGFILVEVTLQEQAVSSGTQGLNRANTLTGDFIYTLYKPSSSEIRNEQIKSNTLDSVQYVKKRLNELITSHEGITPSRLYEKLIPDIISNESYYDNEGKVIDIENILKKNYEYISADVADKKLGDSYVWRVKK